VTGSATLLEKGSLKWLVDCGMFQGNKENEERNWTFTPTRHKTSPLFYSPTPTLITAVSSKTGQRRIQRKSDLHQATLDLCEVMLQDSGHIQEMEAEWK